LPVLCTRADASGGLGCATKRVNCRVGGASQSGRLVYRLDVSRLGPGFALAGRLALTASQKRIGFGRQDTASAVRTRFRPSGHGFGRQDTVSAVRTSRHTSGSGGEIPGSLVVVGDMTARMKSREATLGAIRSARYAEVCLAKRPDNRPDSDDVLADIGRWYWRPVLS
jgi:hypothetical protein